MPAAAPRGTPASNPAGWVSLELALVVGVILFPILMALATLPTWLGYRTAANAAAQEAVREYVRADDPARGAAAARALAYDIATNHDVAASAVEDVTISGGWRRDASVTARVTVRMPVVRFLRAEWGGWSWTAEHTERLDYYRSIDP